MKKILFVINTMGRAGAEMALLELLRCLVKYDGLELSLFVLTGQGEMISQVPEEVKLLNKNFDECSVLLPEGKRHLMKTSAKALFKNGTVFRLFPYLVKQFLDMVKCKRIQPDKLLWRVLSDSAVRFEDEFDLAVAYIEGGSAYYVADHVRAKKKAAFFHVDYSMAGYTRSMDKECYIKYDKTFMVSDEVKEAFLSMYPECTSKTEVFHNLIDQNRILSMAEEPGGFSDEYQGIRILTVGRLTRQKDFVQSVRAMKFLKEKGVNARWYILGDGEQRSVLDSLIRQLGLTEDFILLGMTENPYNYIKQSDIYVHATRYEGKSIAIQEAQVLGKPILVSDCSGNREQVINGVDGLLCELTPEAIAEGVKQLIENEALREQYGKMAAKKHMTEHKETEKLLSLLR
ncbi:MAG: glycosyltransferase [Lachnospiraceae bacterium]|nr:glycosyltransferase [Lachnospiraceae bacterium]